MRFTSSAAVWSVATVLFAGGALAAGAGTAGAVTAPMAEGSFSISAPGCHVVEEIELQGSPKHDYMSWETTADSVGCDVSIIDNNAYIEEQNDLAAGYHHSDWYYDGPGHSMQVTVYSPQAGQVYFGPLN